MNVATLNLTPAAFAIQTGTGLPEYYITFANNETHR